MQGGVQICMKHAGGHWTDERDANNFDRPLDVTKPDLGCNSETGRKCSRTQCPTSWTKTQCPNPWAKSHSSSAWTARRNPMHWCGLQTCTRRSAWAEQRQEQRLKSQRLLLDQTRVTPEDHPTWAKGLQPSKNIYSTKKHWGLLHFKNVLGVCPAGQSCCAGRRGNHRSHTAVPVKTTSILFWSENFTLSNKSWTRAIIHQCLTYWAERRTLVSVPLSRQG